MLELALKNVNALQEAYQYLLGTERLRYYTQASSVPFVLNLEGNSWKPQYVSIDPNGFLVGFFEAEIATDTRTAHNFKMLKFAEGPNETFDKDLFAFIVMLFEDRNLRKLMCSMVVGSPFEHRMQNLLVKLGGTSCGYFKDHAVLQDNRLYDIKFFELFKSKFMRVLNENPQITTSNYRTVDVKPA